MRKRNIAVLWLLSALAMAQVSVGGKFVSGGQAKLQGRPHCSITTQSLPNGTVGTAYSQTVATLNCTAPLTFSVSIGSLPSGLSLNTSTGAITGTPNTNASYAFTIRVDDSAGRHATHSYTVVIGCTALAINTPLLPGGVTGQVYSFQMQSMGGVSPIVWALSTGALPAGITLSSGGLLSGTPTTVQTTSGVIAAIDSCSPTQQIASNTFSLSVIGSLMITTASLPQATEGVAYSAVLSAAGGTAPYTWSVISGTLPAGLTLSSAGLLSGTPTNTGTSSFTIQVQDTGAVNTTTSVFSITISCVPLSITTTSPLPNGVQGTAYSAQLNSSGGTGAVTWSIASGSLPAGVTLSSAGLLSGTAVQNGTFTIGVTAKDTCLPTAQTVATSLTLTIISPVTITTNAVLPGGIEGQPYTVQLAATGGTLPYVWSGTPPAGLILGSGGVISGTPTAAGAFNFPVQVQDANGLTASQTFQLNINCPSLALTSTSPMPPATVGVAYSFQFAGTGGIAPLTWGIPPSGPSMPPGIGLSSSGLASGIPSAAGTFTPTVAVNDSCAPVSQQVSSPFSITVVSQLAITTTSPLPPGTEGQAYSLQFAASGGTTPYTWAVTAGSLPAGLTLSGSGAVSGTPTATGTFTATIRAQDVGAVHTASGSFVIVISCVPMSITTGATLQSGTQGTAYSQQLQASGGNGTKTWSVIGGTLPAGVTLSSVGLLSGTPTVTGTFSPIIQIADSCSPNPQRVSQTFTLVIAQAISPLAFISTSPLPLGTEGTAYSFSMQATGGITPYTWAIAGGSLPTGLSLSSGGAITGTPTVAGTFTASIRVTDSQPLSITSNFSITISCVPLSISTGATLQTGTRTVAYSQQLQASGGNGALTWSVIGGALPAGLTLSSAGVISGTPTVSGTFNPQIQVQDSCAPTPQTTSRTFTLVINEPIAPLTIISTSPLPAATESQPYSFQMQASGGVPPYTWAVTVGSMPAGLSLSSSGLISGTPTATGTSTPTIRVTDSVATNTSQAFSLTVSCVALSISTGATLQSGTQSVAYSQQLQATGGTGALTWSLIGGSLPTGVTLSAGGLLSGTPSATGTFSPQIQVADSCAPTPQTQSRTFSLVINVAIAPLVIVSTSPLPPATEGQTYSFQMQATGGVTPYTWSVISGALPTGLTLSSGGLISGTPTATGISSATIQVTDNAATTKSSSFSMTVSCVPLLLTSANTQLSDTFSTGSLSANWVIDTGAAPGTIAGVNTGSFSSANVSLTQGVLDLKLTQTGAAPVTSVGAEVRSAAMFGYGTYDYYARASSTASSPNGSGTAVSGQITGLFNLCNQPVNPGGCPTYTEIDHEIEGQFPTQDELTNWISTTVNTSSNSTQAGMDTSFHHYRFVWQPGQVLFYFDSTLLGTHTTNIPSAPALILFNHWGTNSTNFGGLASTGVTRHLYLAGFTYSALTALPTATQGTAYSSQLQSSGGTGAKTWSVIGGSLPTGITLSSAGLVSGTPSVSGSFTVVIQVKDSCAPTAQSVAATFTLSVNASLAILTTSPLPNATEGQAYSVQLSATGGSSPYTWSVLSGALPPGFTLSAGGLLRATSYTACNSTSPIQLPSPLPNFGTLTGANTLLTDPEPNNGSNCFHQPIVRVTDGNTLANHGSVHMGDTGVLNRWNQDSSLLLVNTTGGALLLYHFNTATMQATNTGVRFNNTPETFGKSPGNNNVLFELNGTQINKVAINPVTFALTRTLLFNYANATCLGTGFSATWTGEWVTSKDDQSFTVGFSNNGGQETGAYLANFTVGKGCRVLNTNSGVISGDWGALGNINIPQRLLMHEGSQTPNPGFAVYSHTGSTCSVGPCTATDGPFIWEIATATVRICGATQPCDGHNAKGYLHHVAGSRYKPHLYSDPTVVLSPLLSSSLPTDQHGTWNNVDLLDSLMMFAVTTEASYPINPYPFAAYDEIIGIPPNGSGLVRFSHTYNSGLNTSFQVSNAVGTVSQDGRFLAFASDAEGTLGSLTGSNTCQLGGSEWAASTAYGLNQIITPDRSSSIQLNAGHYAFKVITAGTSGLSQPASWPQTVGAAISDGTVTWVNIGAANCRGDVFVVNLGVSASATGTYNTTIQATDSLGAIASKPFSLTVTCTALSITTTSQLASGTQGSAYSQQLQSSGGTGTVSWALTAGSLPPGVTLSTAGLISGTPSGTGTFTPTITASDQCSATAQTTSRAFSMTISAQIPTLVITTTSPLPAGTQGVSYSTNMAATGGVPPYTWTRTAGSLPAGLSLSAAGAITGTPTTIGTSTATIQVADSAAHTASGSFAITVSCVALSVVTTSPLPAGQINVAYSDQLQSSGGTGTKTWSLTAGAFPTGVSVSGAGLISGTPSASGTFTPTVQVADACSTPQTVSRQYSLTIASSPLTITSTSPLPSGGLNTAYSFTLQAAGGTLPYTWSVTVGTLPAGLSLNASTAVISGTPTVAATTTFTIQVADSAAHTTTKQFTVTFPAHTATLTWTASTTAGVTYNVKRSTVSGGPYAPIKTGLTVLTYTDQTVQPATTYYYVVTAQLGTQESVNSNQGTAVIP